MQRPKKISIAIIISLLLNGCAQSVGSFFEKRMPDSDFIPVKFHNGKNGINILYVTCGMLIIESGKDAIFFDPYFSYQKIPAIPFSIHTRKRFYDAFKNRVESTIDKNTVTTGFVSHSHYDHLMDLPVLIHDKYFPNLKKIYGNEFISPMMHHHRNKGVEINTIREDQLYNPLKTDSICKWISVSDSIQVLPIASMHAPHKSGVLAMRGKVNERYFRKEKFKDPYARSKGFKWDVGCSYSFLVRIQKPDGTYFKIFIQTSGSHSPYGLPPAEEKADLAILCFASMQEVDDYPGYLVREINPQKVLLIHWEDFFRYPRNTGDLKIVRGTNKKTAEERIRSMEQLPFKPEIIIPKPGTLITVHSDSGN